MPNLVPQDEIDRRVDLQFLIHHLQLSESLHQLWAPFKRDVSLCRKAIRTGERVHGERNVLRETEIANHRLSDMVLEDVDATDDDIRVAAEESNQLICDSKAIILRWMEVLSERCSTPIRRVHVVT